MRRPETQDVFTSSMVTNPRCHFPRYLMYSINARSSSERREALALDFNFRRRPVDLAQIGRGQFDIDRSKVFLEAMQLCGTGDRHDPGFLSQQPGERDLRGRRALPLGD